MYEDVIPNGAEEDDEPDEFFFESDHLALKGNKDYLSLLKTLTILQAQRSRALQVHSCTLYKEATFPCGLSIPSLLRCYFF